MKLSNKLKLIKSQKGQSLAESVVAISVIVIGILGVLALAVVTLNTARTSKNEIIATNLAREGIETIRWRRDNNWTQQDKEWNDGLTGACYKANFAGMGGLSIEPVEIPCSGQIIYFCKDSYYSHNRTGCTPTIFFRLININYEEDGKRMVVKSIIQWQESGKTHTVKMTDYLYDWMK